MVIETKRLILRVMSQTDFASLGQILQDEKRYIDFYVADCHACYSHLKNLIAMPPQVTAMIAITIRGNRTPSTGSPSEVAFNSLIPWVKGITSAILCRDAGITS